MQRDKIDALHHKALLRESFLRRLSIGPVTWPNRKGTGNRYGQEEKAISNIQHGNTWIGQLAIMSYNLEY